MLVVAATTFGIVALTEIADTSALVTLVLGARFPTRWLLTGVCAAFLVHVVLAVTAGSLLTLLPERPLQAMLAVVFVLGALLLLREDDDDAPTIRDTPGSRWGVVATSFGVTLLSELGDPTEIVVATLAARYGAPIAVGIGALAALWTVSALAVYFGGRLARRVPVRWVIRVTAAILVALGVLSAIAAIRG